MTVKNSVTFPDETYDTGSDCDESNASGQKVVKVAAPTATMVSGDRVIIGRGTDREEEGVIDSVSADVSITLLANLTYNHTVDANTTVDADSNSGQKVLNVAATTNFLAGETIIIDSGGAKEESGVIDSVQAGVSLTLVDNLTNTHLGADAAAVAQTGVGEVVEVIMRDTSTVIRKKHHTKIALSLPSTWTTAAITFLGCMTLDGTYTQVVKGSDAAELSIASVAASKTIGLDGALMEALAHIPYLKLRSGTAATPVDQGDDLEIDYILMR